ncbi:bifunctional DNA primase/polymerase [Mycobacterium marinum]|uniref:bifunctional DNA primase/polymerase n=1 Tax=Mycobacterium marinum TaxID=1781 RepID=UPI00235A16A2|nr:bifunctional DNA primase/polymerase [Mycobacterium marinum]MDC9004091.1 bifunctional DNA primase/polymerase [Mycobacterium marinum]
MIFPNVNGLSVSRAALGYVRAGMPIVPFDPDRGNHKECGNLVGGPNRPTWYEQVTTDTDTISRWRQDFGPFTGLATSPGQFGAVVLDVDHPDLLPADWITHLEMAPLVRTRHGLRGHYWFTSTQLPAMINRKYVWGEVRTKGGGIVLPPYTNRETGHVRTVVRSGAIGALPEQISQVLVAGAGGFDVLVDLADFCAHNARETRPYKLKGIRALYAKQLRGGSRHEAARIALTLGFSEARLGYVPAHKVFDCIRSQWEKSPSELRRLAAWCATVAQNSDLEVLKDKSDRGPGDDSRMYAGALK